MADLVVVGSGACGAHFALSALRKGWSVTLLDVGYLRPTSPLPEASFDRLKSGLPDPLTYFLGDSGEAVVYPASKPSYYGHPPSKTYVFATPRDFHIRARAMQPVFSFARGGLAEAWTAGCYEFADSDLAGFAFGRSDLVPYYQEVARRIGVGGEQDDLERFLPFEAPYLEPLPLDAHSTHLVGRYRERRERLNRELGFYLGRSRVATLSHDSHGRLGCDQLGRCLWGCPRESIYSPAFTLRECLADPRFRYVPGMLVTHFDYDTSGQVTAVHAEPEAGGSAQSFSGDLYALAAGALCSSKLVLDSVYRRTGRVESLSGLMDNRQVHVPFLTLGRIGAASTTAAYQFHHLAFGLERPDPRHYVHGQITTLKAASVHPILAGMPTDLKTALGLFKSVRAGLGIANINLHDTRRPESRLTVRPMESGPRTELVIEYADDPAEANHAREAVKIVTQALGKLGCVVPPGMTRVLPKGTSVHYTGTIPITRDSQPFTCEPNGRSRDFPNLCLVDGATFPFLPAKNLTFTLMANALRIADLVL